MQVCSQTDMEDILRSVTSGLENCTVAIYNMDYSTADKMRAFCITTGARSSQVLMVTSVMHTRSK